jgi:cytochrome c-type biogenesis protein CcmH
MILFGLGALLLVGFVLALLLPPLLARRAVPPAADAAAESTAVGQTRSEVNLAILREQALQLADEHAAGLLSDAAYEAARMELARRTLAESPDAERPARSPATPRSRRTAVLISALVPVLGLGLYARLGSTEALNSAAPAATGAMATAATPGADVTMAQVEAMVSAMAARLENPAPGQAEDPVGWDMLARSLAALQRYSDADRAYARAIALAPGNAQLLADRADLLVLLQDRRSAGEPTRLIEEALKIDPDNLKALALAGSAAFERQDFDAALKHWSRARARATSGSDFANGLDRSIEAARSSAGAGAPPVKAAARQAPAAASAGTSAAAGISGTVSIAPALRARVQPGDTLFVFARAAQGPRMPLAILRLPAGNWPASFQLDDSLAMSPELKLSGFEQVVVQARVSRSGQALPQPGDLIGQTAALKPGTRGIELRLDQVQP